MLYVSRMTGSLYEVVERNKQGVWYRLYTEGIVKQPKNLCSRFSFWLNFKPQ